ncbi:MAG: flagellar basal-body rod protein FlgG [Fibrobacterota bacterium]
MIRSIYSAATGMKAQQMYVDNISNNLANANTVGFKKSRLEFQDLLYQNIQEPGENISEQAVHPTGLQVGLGVQVAGNQKMFTQGNIIQTDNKFDWAIEGDGFFQIMRPDGTIGYSRDGAFKVSSEGVLVNSSGYLLEPEISLPVDGQVDTVTIDTDGRLYIQMVGEDVTQEFGQLEIARFVNPAGLKALGGSLYAATPASGAPIVAKPGEETMGVVEQGKLETSNIMIVEEMVNMIMAQRAYEICSKGVSTSDEMLQIANQLKR